MKKIMGIILILFVCFANCTCAQEKEESKENNEGCIVASFNSTNANFLEASYSVSGKILDKFITLKELEEYSKGFVSNDKDDVDSDVEKIHIIEMLDKQIVDEENNMQIFMYGKDIKENYITVYLNTYKQEDLEETDICIEMYSQNVDDVESCKGMIENTLSSYGIDTEITTCITGTYDGEMNNSKRYKMVYSVLNSLDAEVVEGLKDDSLTSISAYSPKIKNYIFTGEKKMNINVAMRYNEYEDKTYLWMATPVIATGY